MFTEYETDQNPALFFITEITRKNKTTFRMADPQLTQKLFEFFERNPDVVEMLSIRHIPRIEALKCPAGKLHYNPETCKFEIARVPDKPAPKKKTTTIKKKDHKNGDPHKSNKQGKR